jgi:hypothetical protein
MQKSKIQARHTLYSFEFTSTCDRNTSDSPICSFRHGWKFVILKIEFLAKITLDNIAYFYDKNFGKIRSRSKVCVKCFQPYSRDQANLIKLLMRAMFFNSFSVRFSMIAYNAFEYR